MIYRNSKHHSDYQGPHLTRIHNQARWSSVVGVGRGTEGVVQVLNSGTLIRDQNPKRKVLKPTALCRYQLQQLMFLRFVWGGLLPEA